MHTPIYPAEQLAGALALLAQGDPRAEITAALQVYGGAAATDSPPDAWLELEGMYWTLALTLDGRMAYLGRNGGGAEEIRGDWRRTLRELRALLLDPRIAALLEEEG